MIPSDSVGRRARPAWLIPVAVLGGILLLVVLPLISVHNSLVDKDTTVDNAFGDLDTEYQRRVDLIPNLSTAVKAALQQEQTVFGDIARARQNYAGASSSQQKVDAAGQLESGLGRLLVIVEQYPQLQSNQTIQNFMIQLESTENRVGQARRTYNAAVTDYNRSIRRFPRSLVAGLFGFDKRPLFSTDPASRTAPTVNLDTSSTTSTTLAR